MITIFNRKELLMTFDMQKQGVVRRMLVENGIKYTVDVVNLPGSFPSFEGQKTMPGSQEEKLALQNQYTIYVKKSDYDTACGLMRLKLRDVL